MPLPIWLTCSSGPATQNNDPFLVRLRLRLQNFRASFVPAATISGALSPLSKPAVCLNRERKHALRPSLVSLFIETAVKGFILTSTARVPSRRKEGARPRQRVDSNAHSTPEAEGWTINHLDHREYLHRRLPRLGVAGPPSSSFNKIFFLTYPTPSPNRNQTLSALTVACPIPACIGHRWVLLWPMTPFGPQLILHLALEASETTPAPGKDIVR
jgi:hypothetical protein